MSVTLDQSRTPCAIHLTGEVGIRNAAELKELLLQALMSETELRVDISGATEVDITTLQLLWVAEREAHSAGKKFLLDGKIPDDILATANHAGLKLPVSAA